MKSGLSSGGLISPTIENAASRKALSCQLFHEIVFKGKKELSLGKVYSLVQHHPSSGYWTPCIEGDDGVL